MVAAINTISSFNLFRTNGISHRASYNKVRMIYWVYCGYTCYNFPKNIVFLSMKIYFDFANSADPDEMPHDAAFHLDIHCLSKYPFRGFWSKQG